MWMLLRELLTEEGPLHHRGRLDLISARQLWHNAANMSQDSLLGARIGQLQDYRALVYLPLFFGTPLRLAWH